MAYARTTDERQRQFIVIGTTNDRIGYLKDPTGGRRFWPVRVDRFDTDKLNADRDQLWAEAAAREATGASIRMDPALWDAAGRQQESRRAVDPWEDLLVDALIDDAQGKPEFVEAVDVWNVIGVQADRRDSRASARISAIMQRLGYPTKRKHRVSKDRRVMCWLRDGVGSDQILPEVS
jgi:predicted P-loop ATPase